MYKGQNDAKNIIPRRIGYLCSSLSKTSIFLIKSSPGIN